jgi:hypothetical protein
MMFDHSGQRLPRLARPSRGGSAHVLDRVEEALQGLRHGQVTVIVQDGVIVQVERTDRLRLTRNKSRDR